MNMRMAGQVIRDQVTIEQILDLYGYRTKHGFMCCPFHGEKEPSLKVYGGTKGWHCFGCELGGSVIDFVMEHENCKFADAVRAIDTALHLGLLDPHENPFEAKDRQRAQDALDKFVKAVYEFLDYQARKIEIDQTRLIEKVKALEEKLCNDIQSVTADEWTVIDSWKDESEYNDYRQAKIEEFKEEVAAWRRKARRTG